MIMVRIVCQSLTFIAQPLVKAWGHEGVSWGCFKDFEEHLITVYEIVQYYMEVPLMGSSIMGAHAKLT